MIGIQIYLIVGGILALIALFSYFGMAKVEGDKNNLLAICGAVALIVVLWPIFIFFVLSQVKK